MDVDTDALQSLYKQLNDLLGTEAMLKFYHEFRGSQLNPPMKLYDRDGAIDAIQSQYPELSTKDLANKYGYSQHWVKRVISQHSEPHD